MASSRPKVELSPIQRDVLREFFARERGFFLTGGAALAGFHLHHRPTTDLDLFTLDDASFERGRHVLGAAAAGLGASLDIRQDAPGFLRSAVTRGTETLIVDLVRERVPQARPQKLLFEGIQVDPPEEILANKLTALVGRAEERDVIDVYFLERRLQGRRRAGCGACEGWRMHTRPTRLDPLADRDPRHRALTSGVRAANAERVLGEPGPALQARCAGQIGSRSRR
jgi:Nucleotidyl transferase AbiEii toxin, Type IV TA system